MFEHGLQSFLLLPLKLSRCTPHEFPNRRRIPSVYLVHDFSETPQIGIIPSKDRFKLDEEGYQGLRLL